MTPQATGNMRQYGYAVLQFNGECRARKDLPDRSGNLKRRFLRDRRGAFDLRLAGHSVSAALYHAFPLFLTGLSVNYP
jgi:hypothetical protein